MTKDGNNQDLIKTLSPADADALDALTDGADTLSFSTDDGRGERTQRVAAVVGLIQQCPAEEPSDDLVRRTLAHVAEARQRERFVQQAQALSAPAVAFRWSELIAVAAVLLISLSLVWPALERSRVEARRAACAANLSEAGVAIGQYAADHAGMLPRGKTRPNSAWWHTGKKPAEDGTVESNSYHLYLLARHRYLHPQTLACPENALAPANMTADMHDWPSPEATSYSYQNMYRPDPVSLRDVRNLAVLADKNPLFDGAQYNRDLLPESPSDLHGRVGQNILTVGGNVVWSSDPMLHGDNIWLPAGRDPLSIEITGTEIPAGPSDSFLVP